MKLRKHFCWLLGHFPEAKTCDLGCYHCRHCGKYMSEFSYEVLKDRYLS